MSLRDDLTKVKVLLSEKFKKLGTVESGFKPEIHANLFHKDGSGNIDDYLKSVVLDFRDQRIIPRETEKLLEAAQQKKLVTKWREEGVTTRILKQNAVLTQALAINAAKDVLDLHGKSLREALQKRREHDEIEKKQAEPEKTTDEDWLEEVYSCHYWALVAHAFNNTIINHWEEVNNLKLSERQRRAVHESFRGKTPLDFVVHIRTALKKNQEEEEQKAETRNNLEERRKSALGEANWILNRFILGTDAGRIKEKIEKKIMQSRDEKEVDEVLRQIEKTAMASHNRKLNKLSSRQAYEELNIKARLEAVRKAIFSQTDDKQIADDHVNNLVFYLVHLMEEGRPAKQIDEQLPQLLEEAKNKSTSNATTAVETIEPKRDFSGFISEFNLIQDQGRALAGTLNSINNHFGKRYFDEKFLPAVITRLHSGSSYGEIASVIEEERKKHYDRPEKVPITTQEKEEEREKKPEKEKEAKEFSLGELLKMIEDREVTFINPEHLNSLKKKEIFEKGSEKEKLRAVEHVLLRFLTTGPVANLHDKAFKTHVPTFMKKYAEDARDNLKRNKFIREKDSNSNKWAIVSSLHSKYGETRKREAEKRKGKK